MSEEVSRFDPNAALGRGISLLEASAGTGKTHSLTDLLLRLVAEQGLRIERILVVTFTRAATAELRERVRRRIAQGIQVLERARREPSWTPGASDDPVLRGLVDRARAVDQLAHWRRRLMAAHESFDEAAISTIHGFCQRALQQGAFESDLDLEVELVEDLEPLLEQLVDDFMALQLHGCSPEWYRYVRDVARVDRRDLIALARVLEHDPRLHVLPTQGGDLDAEGAWRASMAEFERVFARSGRQAEKLLRAAHAARAFRNSDYAGKKPTEHRRTLEAVFAGGEPDSFELAAALRAFGLRQVLLTAWPERDIEHHEVFVAAQHVIDHSAEVLKLRFVEHVRRELPRRKRERNVLSFDDLLRRLDDALTAPDLPDPERLRARIREQFDAALIDEFQDTDPVQWEIFRTVFGADAWLVLVGDPKQAIYGFRGADVYTYLRARESSAGSRHTLVVNWRSDESYVQALNVLLGVPGVFGEQGIEYVPVHACEGHARDRLRFGQTPVPPLQIKWFSRRLYERRGPIPRNWTQLPGHVAADVVKLLAGGAEIRDDAVDVWRPLAPRDVAVLVRRNVEARQIQAALLDVGVPAVISGAGSVFQSPEADALQRLLDALLQPSSEGLAKAAWTSVLFGLSADELAAMDDVRWELALERLHEWGSAWREQGFARTLRRIFSEEAVPGRLLARPDGERTMTNLLHLVELVHVAETRERLGPSALAAWLRKRRLDQETRHEEAELRLESDADAVTILTVHRSKGLEFPVVLCPTLWDGQLLKPGFGEDRHLRFHLGDEARTPALDLRLSATHGPKLDNARRAMQERQAEHMRLLYVALTRAKHHCVVYWGAFRDHETAALGRVLHGARGAVDGGGVWRLPALGDDELREDLEHLVAGNPGRLALVEAEPVVATRWLGAGVPRPLLAARVFAREQIDRWWRRASYTSLTRQADHRRAEEGSPEAEGRDLDGDAGGLELDPDLAIPVDAPAVPLCEFPRGAAAGTFLHRCLELCDFERAGDPAALEPLLREQMTAHGIAERWLEPLRDGLSGALHTPLGGPLGSVCLADVARRDRLDELGFEFPVAGGYEPVSGRDHVRARALADVFRRHRPPTENLSADYLERLGALGFGPPLRGFLAGAIDLVFRREHAGRMRWFIVDYKSNWLGARDWRTSTVHHYAPAALARAMEQHDYYLQYHLYALALHRYLRWRVPGYSYASDFGGCYYLFVRGMLGPGTPRRDEHCHGVFFDRPRVDLIDALDRLFARPESVDPGKGAHE